MRKHRVSNLMVALGGVGLLLGISVPRAGAQLTSFSAKNYSGRYVCDEANYEGHSVVIKYGPNGGGAYMAGTLVAAENDFVSPIVSIPAAAFCTYELNLASSSYTISADGHGFEQLVWTLSSTNPNCTGPATFTDQRIIVLRNTPNAANQVQRADFSSVDNLGRPDAGHGTCYK
jgi:hypothetical protein